MAGVAEDITFKDSIAVKTSSYSVGLDILRVLSVFFVIAFVHSRDYSTVLCNKIDGGYFPAWGYIVGAMAAMFFTSGYLISRHNVVLCLYDVKKFYLKRLFRIVPLYFLALLIWPYKNVWWMKALALLGINNFLPRIATHGPMHAVQGSTIFQILTLWFVSVIIVFYFIYPLWNLLRGIKSKLVIAFVIEVIFILGWYFCGWEDRMFFYFPFFVLGCLVSEISEYKLLVPFGSLSILYFILRQCAMFSDFDIVMRPLRFFVIYSFSIVTGLILSRYAKGSIKIVKMMAYASFCAYLFHRHIYALLMHFIPTSDGCNRILFIYLFIIPVIYVVGYIVQSLYDKILNSYVKQN